MRPKEKPQVRPAEVAPLTPFALARLATFDMMHGRIAQNAATLPVTAVTGQLSGPPPKTAMQPAVEVQERTRKIEIPCLQLHNAQGVPPPSAFAVSQKSTLFND